MTDHGRIRLAYVNHTGAVSGAEVVLINMVRGLDRSKYDPIAICPQEGELAGRLATEGIASFPLPPVAARFTWRPDKLLRAALSLTRAIFALRRTLSRTAPDIVHANSLRAGVVASLGSVGSGRKVVWHVHDHLPQHPLSTVIRIAALLLRPARVIAVSHATARAFKGSFAFKGVVVTVHNGVDLRRFPLKGQERSQTRAALGVPEDAFLVCAVGQICARKGLLELIEAFQIAHAQAPKMHLMIAGSVVFEHEERYLERLRRAAAEPSLAGKVRFMGQVLDVSSLLRTADLMVLNSREEPFGLVLVEAMASGTPVLATRTGGIPEIVTDGENGWLVEKADTAGLASKLLELEGNRDVLDKVAGRARDVTCPQFSVERFQMRIQAIYAKLLTTEKDTMSAQYVNQYL
jgi:glycosyltransferase involved in cell wall biosynthesis